MIGCIIWSRCSNLYFRMLIIKIILCTLEVTVIPWKVKGCIGETFPRLYLIQTYFITVTYSDPSFHFVWLCLFPFLQTGFLPNVFKVLSYWPLEFRAFFAYYNAIYNKETGKWKGVLTHSWTKPICWAPASSISRVLVYYISKQLSCCDISGFLFY